MNKNEQAIKELREAFYDAWQVIKATITEVLDIIFKRGRHKEYDNNWRIPKSIVLNHQVLDRKPKLPNIRSQL